MIIDNNAAKAMNESMEAAADEMVELTKEDFDSIQEGDIDSEKAKETLTVEFILEKMDEIRADNAHIHEAMKEIGSISTQSNNGLSEAERAKAIAAVVQCRETTNQKLLSMYEKMYEGIVPAKVNVLSEEKVQILNHMIEIAGNNFGEDVGADFYNNVLDMFRLCSVCD